jgi:hypothetical protein
LRRFLAARRLEATGYQAAQVSTHGFNAQPWARIGGNDVLLLGDAAGQVKLTTVGGVVTGLRGARAATSALLRHGDYVAELQGLKRELDLHLVLRRVLDRFAIESAGQGHPASAHPGRDGAHLLAAGAGAAPVASAGGQGFGASAQKIVPIGRIFWAFFRYIVEWDYKVLVVVTSSRRTEKHGHGN